MYETPVFAMTDRDASIEAIAEARIVELVTSGVDGLEASIVPTSWEDDGTEHGRLIGHLTRRNPQWSDIGARRLWLLAMTCVGDSW